MEKGSQTRVFDTEEEKGTISKSSLCVSFPSLIQQLLWSEYCVHSLFYG